LVYYMPAANLAAIASSLIAAGRSTDTPAALVHNATLPDQCTFFTTLGELRYALLLHATPLLLLIGDVVAFENRQAELQPALFTGTSADDVPPSITAVHTPLIRTQRLEPPQQELLHALRHIDRYRLLILTSRHAVHYLFGLMAEHGIPRPAIDIATIGPRTTAALSSHGGTAAIQSPTETARGLLPLLNSEPLNILFPRSARADDTFPEALRLLGHTVDTFPLYTTLTVPDPPIVDITRFSKIFLPSPSAIDAFVHHYGDFPPLTLLIARGPTTFAHLRRTALPTSTL
jgi:uroporphyrinogen III methyltransferase/synthase